MVLGICSTLVLCTTLWWEAKEIALNKAKDSVLSKAIHIYMDYANLKKIVNTLLLILCATMKFVPVWIVRSISIVLI